MSKGEVSSLHARADKDREDMVKDYQGSLELIFAYGYGCCVFKNTICGDRLEILDGMPYSANLLPPEFFFNPRCPPSPTTFEAKHAEEDQGGAVQDSKGGGGVLLPRNRAFFHMLASTILENFASGFVFPLLHIYFICNL